VPLSALGLFTLYVLLVVSVAAFLAVDGKAVGAVLVIVEITDREIGIAFSTKLGQPRLSA
jgi:hypothetical protein